MPTDNYDQLPTATLAWIVWGEVERADAIAMATDGTVPPTWEVMGENELRRFFRASYVIARRVLDGD